MDGFMSFLKCNTFWALFGEWLLLVYFSAKTVSRSFQGRRKGKIVPLSPGFCSVGFLGWSSKIRNFRSTIEP
jgi:hypothetical protein